MNRGAVVADQAELIKWFDALDKLAVWSSPHEGLEMARECQHADAQWLAALFAPGTHVTPEGMREAMMEQGDDPRALYLASRLVKWDLGLLMRAAHGSFARAQVDLAARTADNAERLRLLEKASEQNDREGLFQLGRLLRLYRKDEAKATELFRRAAELNYHRAQLMYGQMGFGERDWERFHWRTKAAEGGLGVPQLCCDVAKLLPSFERGEFGRILSTVEPVIRKNLAIWREDATICMHLDGGEIETGDLERVFEMHAAMLRRARRAVDCWSIVGRRCGVVKDMRVMIAKMLWAEPWRWGEKERVRR
jgi:hypothetical protein